MGVAEADRGYRSRGNGDSEPYAGYWLYWVGGAGLRSAPGKHVPGKPGNGKKAG